MAATLAQVVSDGATVATNTLTLNLAQGSESNHFWFICTMSPAEDVVSILHQNVNYVEQENFANAWMRTKVYLGTPTGTPGTSLLLTLTGATSPTATVAEYAYTAVGAPTSYEDDSTGSSPTIQPPAFTTTAGKKYVGIFLAASSIPVDTHINSVSIDESFTVQDENNAGRWRDTFLADHVEIVGDGGTVQPSWQFDTGSYHIYGVTAYVEILSGGRRPIILSGVGRGVARSI